MAKKLDLDALFERAANEPEPTFYSCAVIALATRISELEAARIAYASEFPLTDDGEPDVGNIHANIRKLKVETATGDENHG